MSGGLVGYLGYDMVRLMERLPEQNPDELGVPDALLIRPSLFAIFDNVNDELTLLAAVYPSAGDSGGGRMGGGGGASGGGAGGAGSTAAASGTCGGFAGCAGTSLQYDRTGILGRDWPSKGYIAAGDAFQIVLSQCFSAPFALPPFSLYRALRRINPAPFLFFLDFGGFAVVGSSPEILVRLRDGTVTLRPLAGTRRRGDSHEEDQAMEAELLSDPKERAEHLMLLDLGRNDVGRVAELGSVQVTESFVIERFSHVMHISSNVEGRLRDDLDALDALVASFPAGTLSGAPKVRAMEIIEELEPTDAASTPDASAILPRMGRWTRVSVCARLW